MNKRRGRQAAKLRRMVALSAIQVRLAEGCTSVFGLAHWGSRELNDRDRERMHAEADVLWHRIGTTS